MKKILQSGIEVEADDYYKLLVWREENMDKFNFWIESMRIKSRAINKLTQPEYNSLLEYANIK